MVNTICGATYAMLQVNWYILSFWWLVSYLVLYPPIEVSSLPIPYPSGLIASEANRAESFYKSGNEKRENKDYKGAIADFTKAIRLNPNEAPVYVLRGYAKFSLGDKQGNLRDFQEAARKYIRV